MALDVTVLHKGEDVLMVCKPASVPVHPCGQYRKNTVVGILQAEHDLAPLFHRLVSGLFILARSASQAEIFRHQWVNDIGGPEVVGNKFLRRKKDAKLPVFVPPKA